MYDWSGKSLEASVVFAHSIIYLKKLISEEIEKVFFDIENKEIEYAFTVPETKGDKATLLIREAAIKVIYVTISKKYGETIYYHMFCFILTIQQLFQNMKRFAKKKKKKIQ